MVLSPSRARAAALAAALLGSWAIAPRAQALPPPSAEALAALRATCETHPVMRITTERNRYEVSRPAPDSDGFRFDREHGRPALIMVGSVPSREVRIPWAEITKVESGRRHLLGHALVGTITGLLVGVVLLGGAGEGLLEPGDLPPVVAWTAVGTLGLTAGTLHGLACPHWTPVSLD